VTGSEVTGFMAFDTVFTGGGYVAAPPPQSRMFVDVPAAGATMPSTFLIGGWALQGNASGDSGVDVIDIWAFPVAGGPAFFLGTATLGVPRGDVGAAFGGYFSESGFDLVAGPIAPGTYDLAVVMRNSRSGLFAGYRVVRVVVTP
jgi:hypothetical protein